MIRIFKNTIYITLGCLLLLTTVAPTASALSVEQKKVFDSGVYYYDVEANQDSCASATLLSGSTNEEKVWNYLVGTMGFSAVQAAGAMTNIQRESGFNPHALNPSTTSPTPVSIGRAWGLIQWFGGRQTNLINFAADKDHTFGQDANADLQIQLEFMKLELETSYKSSVLDPILASTTVEESTRIWLEKYEAPCPNPSDPNCDVEFGERLPGAQDYLARYGSAGSPSPGNASCGLGVLPDGDARALASILLNSPNVTADNRDQLESIAAGFGPCPTVNNGDYTVDTELLRVLSALAQNNTYTVSSLHRGCTGSTVGAGTASKHWQGKAADISGSRGINSVVMPSFEAYDESGVIQKFINETKSYLKNGCGLGVPNQRYIQGAEAQISECNNLFLDTTATTGATGPHVHIGVP